MMGLFPLFLYTYRPGGSGLPHGRKSPDVTSIGAGRSIKENVVSSGCHAFGVSCERERLPREVD